MTNTGPDTFYASTGGTLLYNIEAGNNETSPVTADIWADLTLPTGGSYGPIIGPVLDFTLNAGWSGDRDRELTVPAGLPPTLAGTFSTNGYIGEYSDVICVQDSFTWEYVNDTAGDGLLELGGLWFTSSGESFEDLRMAGTNVLPVAYSIHQSYPNPFNPTSTISFSLPEAGKITLSVYDVSGRLITTLVDGYRSAGVHDVTFDASDLASGIYLYRLEAGEFNATGKMVLMK